MPRLPDPRRKPDQYLESLIALDVPATLQPLVSLEPATSAGQDEEQEIPHLMTVAESSGANAENSTAAETAMRQRPTSAFPGKEDVLYVHPDGSRSLHQGGTRSWRNNNPGNVWYGDFAKGYGAIGRDKENFAIFPDEAAGERAMRALLKTGKNFREASINAAIEKYAPKDSNNTAAYQKFILRDVGVSDTTLTRNLTPEQFEKFVAGIRRFEGWRVGKIIRHGSED